MKQKIRMNMSEEKYYYNKLKQIDKQEIANRYISKDYEEVQIEQGKPIDLSVLTEAALEYAKNTYKSNRRALEQELQMDCRDDNDKHNAAAIDTNNKLR